MSEVILSIFNAKDRTIIAEITFSCFIYGTNDIVTSDHANITDQLVCYICFKNNNKFE